MQTREQLTADGVTFDNAIPQSIWQEILDITGENPLGHIVMVYPSCTIFGELCAVTIEGEMMLDTWKQRRF